MLGGAAGLAAMGFIMKRTGRWVKKREPQPLDVFATERSMSLVGVQHQEGESATQAVGRILYTKVAGEPPDEETGVKLAEAVHLGYGLLVAGLYGLFASGRSSIRRGVAYGIGLWALGDELAVPLLGLADKPTRYHPTFHLQALAGHIAYGAATGATTQLASRLLAKGG